LKPNGHWNPEHERLTMGGFRTLRVSPRPEGDQMKPPNGSWDPSRDQDVIIAQVAEDAARAIRSGDRRHQIAPKIDHHAPSRARPVSPEGMMAWLKRLPWWALVLLGIYLGAWLNKH
jgi:hypothetical protein